jgi:hypothetical protein
VHVSISKLSSFLHFRWPCWAKNWSYSSYSSILRRMTRPIFFLIFFLASQTYANTLTLACGENAQTVLAEIGAGADSALALKKVPVWVALSSFNSGDVGRVHIPWTIRYVDSKKHITLEYSLKFGTLEQRRDDFVAGHGYDYVVFKDINSCVQGQVTSAYVSNSYTHGGPPQISSQRKDCLCLVK